MSYGIVYQVSGAKYWPMLTVSLFSLRKHTDWPVCIIAADHDGYEIARSLKMDGRLGDITVIQWDKPEGRGKGQGHARKTYVPELTPFDRTIFLDADTAVLGPIGELLPEDDEVRLTQFCEWVTTGPIMRGRIKRWIDILPMECARMLDVAYPSINTGAFGLSRKASAFSQRWKAETWRQPIFQCDELVANLIFPDYPHLIMDDRWNWSPVHSKREAIDDVRVAHFHGFKQVKNERARAIWLPLYQQCCELNIARINEWTPAGDRRLKRFLGEQKAKFD